MTSDKIEQWKNTQRGPDKLADALQNTSLDVDLRKLSAVALIDIREHQKFVTAFTAMSTSDRRRIGVKLADLLSKRLSNTNLGPERAIVAKDALFSLHGSLPADTRVRVEKVLMKWIVSNWFISGDNVYSSERIAADIGQPAARALAEALLVDAKTLPIFCELIGKAGSQADREHAAKILISAITNASQSRMGRLLSSLATLRTSLGRRYLLRRAMDKHGSLADRVTALQALATDPDTTSLSSLAKIARSRQYDNALRGAAFQAIETIHDRASADILAEIVSNDRIATVRYRAAEALIVCCAIEGASKLLETLPAHRTYRDADIDDFLVRDIIGLGAQRVLPLVRRVAADAQSWISAVVALRVLSKIGSPEDVEIFRNMRDNHMATRLVLSGARVISSQREPAVSSVGAEAARLLKRMRSRLNNPTDPAAI